MFIEDGADIETKDSNGCTVLYWGDFISVEIILIN
jgi:hypothetical protein